MDPQALLGLLEISPPAHLGFIYDPRDPWRQVALSFAARGLLQGEQVNYFYSHGSSQDQAADLGRLGVNAEAALSKGQLFIMPAEDFYLPQGRFDPEEQISRAERALEQVLRQGYRRVRTVAEMDWAASQDPMDLSLLAEYENLLNERIFNNYPLSALCAYDRRRFNPLWQDMVCRHHPLLLSQAGIIRPAQSLA